MNSHHVYRTVWLSDIHLGCKDCKADYLQDFLERTDCATLILAGDIIDLWALNKKSHWPASHTRLLEQLAVKALSGTRIIYVPGNHDSTLRRFNFLPSGLVTITDRHEHVTATGKRLLVVHGDEFDGAISLNPWLSRLGDHGYDLLLWLNRLGHRVQRWLGRDYWSLANYIKTRVRNANAAITRYRNAATRRAAQQGYDGIVCGHIHHPEIIDEHGVLYCNAGDWIENCSALAEHPDGTLELLRWTDTATVLTRAKGALPRRLKDAA